MILLPYSTYSCCMLQRQVDCVDPWARLAAIRCAPAQMCGGVSPRRRGARARRAGRTHSCTVRYTQSPVCISEFHAAVSLCAQQYAIACTLLYELLSVYRTFDPYKNEMAIG